MTATYVGSDSVRVGGALFSPANRTRFTLMVAYPAHHQGADAAALLFRSIDQTELIQKFKDADLDATVTNATGLYDGSEEISARCEVIVELADDPAAGNRLIELAETLSIEWDQDEVWLVSEAVSLMPIGRAR